MTDERDSTDCEHGRDPGDCQRCANDLIAALREHLATAERELVAANQLREAESNRAYGFFVERAALLAHAERLAKALEARREHGCNCALNEGPEQCESCEQSKAALLKYRAEHPLKEGP